MIKINPELKDFIDTLSPLEREGLQEDIIKSGGAREPIVVWKEEGVIVDGHNRYEICTANDLPYTTTEISFPDISEAKMWMLRNQLNRRNLSPTRISYYRGTVYNELKKAPSEKRESEAGATTAEKLGEVYGVDEKTIRRDGDVAKGIDAVGEAHGVTSLREKLAKITEKNKGFNKQELEEIGKVKDPEIRVATVKELEKIKEADAKAKAAQAQAVKKQKEEAKPLREKAAQKEKVSPYTVAFCKPDFGSISYNISTEVKPPLGENAICYMSVADEDLPKAMDLLKKWNLSYEGSVIFTLEEGYEGTFTDVRHSFLIISTKGTMAMSGKAPLSMFPKNGNVDEAMIKIIESNHPKDKRLDMRRERTAKGWEKL